MIEKALLLAAGLGTRLRPLTDQIPKCMVEIDNQPLLGHWIDNLRKAGCKEVLINTHYKAEMVEEYLRSKDFNDINIRTVYEPELLGTAGTLIKNREFFEHKNSYIIHADNAMKENIAELGKSHSTRPANCVMTMMIFNTANPEECGIVKPIMRE